MEQQPTCSPLLLLQVLPTQESLEELYQATPWSVSSIESYEMDQLLFALQTPAHQSLFVLLHAFQASDNIATTLNHCRHLWKPNSQFESSRLEAILKEQLHHQQQRSKGCITTRAKQIEKTDDSNSKPQSSKKLMDQIVALQGTGGQPHTVKPKQLLQNLYVHLYLTLGTDLRNGAAADVALSLSLSGLSDDLVNVVLDCLAHIAALELQRKKTKGSRRASDILMVVEKLAASGCGGNNNNYYYLDMAVQAARDSLEGSKGSENLEQADLKFVRLWSPRSLLWLWRRGHLLHKVSREDIASSLTLGNLQPPAFDDPTLPLVVDVGCGLGVSLIGLLASASEPSEHTTTTTQPPLNRLDWSRCNYIGGDLSPAAVRWAGALTTRWKLTGQCQFYHVSTETLLDYLLQSKLNVALILLQFPTPYRLQQQEDNDDNNEDSNSSGCNLKLPSGPHDETFMANPKILKRMVDLLKQSNNKQPGYLLIQSNCEDVAMQIADVLTENLGLLAVPSETPRTLKSLATTTTPTARTKAWLKEQHHQADNNHGCSLRRAAGESWSAEPYLPVMTETEASCMHHDTPVHRCLFRPVSTKGSAGQ